jgi:glycosyltransferase involved in cell wall biosynthesis
MKILFCSNERFLPLMGGGSAGNLKIVEMMVRRGHQVTVATPLYIDPHPIERRYGIRLRPCAPFKIHRTVRFRELKYGSYILIFARHLKRLLQRERYDLVFIRNCILGISATLIRPWLKVPLAISMTDFISGFLYEDKRYPRRVVDALVQMEKWIADSADRTFVITPRMKQVLVERGGDPERIFVTYDGVDTDCFDPARVSAEEVARVREELGLEGRPTVIYHGIIDPYHGIRVLSEVIRKTLERIDVNFLIIGDEDGVKRIRRQVTTDRARFMNFVRYEDVPTYIAAADVGMIPYTPNFNLNLVFTLKFIEYLSMGNPVTCFGLRSIADMFSDCEYVHISRDVDHFVENLARACGTRKYPEAVELVQREFSWDVVTRKIVEELERFVDGRGGGSR